MKKFKKNKKAFTLIEILAIIILLGIIAVITIPQVNKTIKDSKKNAAKNSAYGYKDAVHQYFLTNLVDDNSFNLNGDYTISDGNIINDNGTFNIPSNGSIPESGDVFIENGEIIEGCISFGKNSVVIEDGNVVDTIEGDCFNTSYFTYDENAAEGSHGKITERQSQPNSSWKYYIKEKESNYSYGYGIWYKDQGEIEQAIAANGNYTLAECEKVIDANCSATNCSDKEKFICRKTNNKLKLYELCGVENGKTFCLKTGFESYKTSSGILDSVYDNCSTYELGYLNYYHCDGEDTSIEISLQMPYDSFIYGYVRDSSSQNECFVMHGYTDSVTTPETHYHCANTSS